MKKYSLSFYPKDIPTFKELVIKNTPVKKFSFLWKSLTCFMDKSHYEKTQPFITKYLPH